MQEYEVTLENGVVTTMQLSDEDAKAYNAKPLRKPTKGETEVAAEASAAKRTRGSRETR